MKGKKDKVKEPAAPAPQAAKPKKKRVKPTGPMDAILKTRRSTRSIARVGAKKGTQPNNKKKADVPVRIRGLRAKPLTIARDETDPYELLNEQHKLFVDNYLITNFNATQAAIRSGYSRNTAYAQGGHVLKYPNVAAAIKKRIADRNARMEKEQDAVLAEWEKTAFADVNELVQFRRTCCRFCYGEDFKYQRTAGEMEADRELHAIKEIEMAKLGIQIAEFNEKGGIGFDKLRDPNQECPECRGEGLGDVFFMDTRNLSPQALALYAGVEIGKDGIKMKMVSKEKAQEMLARHRGLLVERSEVTFTDMNTAALNARFTEKMAKAHLRAKAIRDERGDIKD